MRTNQKKLKTTGSASTEWLVVLLLMGFTHDICAQTGSWPSDGFCLPAVPGPSACPSALFQQGTRFWDTEDLGSHNRWQGAVPRGDYSLNNLEQTFCCHPQQAAVTSTQWPDGTYCIARYGGSCPSGFASGSIKQDDEDLNNKNSVTNAGSLPDGQYDRNTLINYCCKNGVQVTPSQAATGFPTTAPFILYQYGSQCQLVQGLRLSTGSVTWDNENDFGWNDGTNYQGQLPSGNKGDDTELRYCLYTPGCYATLFTDDDFEGLASVTLPAGSYSSSDLSNYVFTPREIESIRVPSGCSVTVYSDDNFTGNSHQFTGDVSDLGNVREGTIGSWENEVESLVIS